MTNRLSLWTALALGCVVAVPASVLVSQVASAADKEKKNTVTPALAKSLKAAQDALTAKKYPEAIAKLQEVRAMPNRTPYDNFVIAELSYPAYAGVKDYEHAAEYMEEVVNSGFAAPDDLPRLTRSLAQVAYQLKNYDKAIEFGNRAIKLGGVDEEFYTMVGQAYYIKNDFKGAYKFFTSYVDEQQRAGHSPKEQTLQLIMSSCIKMNDDACTTRALEQLVAHYPKPDYWKNLIYSLRKSSNSNDNTTLNIDRLASDVDAMGPGDYSDMAQLAMEAGLPGEAQSILEKGFAKGVFTEARDKDKYNRLLEAARKQATADKAQLSAQEAQTSAAKAGDPDVKLGLAYLTYGEYDKAVAAIQRGLGKGGVKNPDEADILLGIAELKLRNRDEAIKAFKSAKADPNLTRLAGLWVLHAQQG